MRESLSAGRLQGVIELGAIVIEHHCHGGHRVAFDRKSGVGMGGTGGHR